MGYVSEIGIAIISKQKAVFELIKEDFMQSKFYQNNTDVAKEFLDLFQNKRKGSQHLMVVYHTYIKWYADIERAWKVFSKICDNFNVAWCFVRIGEDYGDIEKDDNYHKVKDCDDLMQPSGIFDICCEIRCLI